ncbi:MAG: FGGY-family carbohydrate kinase [Phycisphaerales bacterium]|nr:MAG: FGGY-family carbohydrate kinase [Phycisphaerales bacterium]
MSTQNEKYVLAVDIGTSCTKSALVSTRGEIVDMESEENRLILLEDGGAEQDPDQWWRAVEKTFKRLLVKKLVPVDDIIAVSCTGQWSGTVAVGKDGRPVMNAIIWMDSRGRRYVNEITDGWVRIRGYGISKLFRWLRLTGGAPCHSGKDPISHILYIKNVCPEVYRKTYKFLEPTDYINLRFTGRFAASFDSIALHWLTDNRKISNVAYDRRLIDISTIDQAKLPALKRAVDVLGPIRKETAKELGLNEDVRVIVGTPDVQSAAIGCGAVRDFEPHLYLGTSSWLTCHVPFKKTDLRSNIATLPSAIPTRYFVANEQETAGACLNFLKNNVCCPSERSPDAQQTNEWALLDDIAEKVPAGSNKVIFTPWLYGERTPIEDASVRACFFNQSLRTTREDLVRSVYEGVAYNSRWLLQYVERFVKRRLDNIRMIGGGAKSDVWCQMYADVLDRTIKQVKGPVQANLRGAAFLASIALGHMTFDDVPERVEIAETFRPSAENRRIYDELFARFKEVYASNKAIYERLNRP